ncbi:hypothetical protein A4X13_0g4985 [Tilletia indica]|uniref:Uncharacterized protein n=1 Tax=Tilletia indica TaxID=43049 RepID=A0A177TMU6_9BASI|nr:hypothetical protein A4X13_0g4985 [Tilletia indica]
MTTPSAATMAAEGGSKDKNDLANLQQTRSQLINMLTLLDPVAAASLSQSQQQQQTLGPGLSQVLIPLLAPILQPLDQLKQQQQPSAHFANTIRTALHKAGELAKSLSTDTADENKDNNTKRKPPSAPIQQALDLIHRATSATTSSSSEDVLHPILLLRKRKRQAEDAQRAARRRRTADTVAFIESTSLSSISASRIDSQVPPAKKQRSRQLGFPPPRVNLNAHTEELLLRSQTLESYLAAIQAHPAWKQPRLASHSTSNNTLGAGAQQKDESDVRMHRIALSVYSSALSASTSRWSSLLYSSSGTDSERGQIETSSSSSAAILVQIEGVLQALLTLGLRRSDPQKKPRVVLVHANIRSALEMEPLDDGKAGSAGGGGGMGSAQQQRQGALPGSAHLSSSSPLHRSLSSDLMAFLARERERERLSVTSTERSDPMEKDGDGEGAAEAAIWREVGMALMFVRGLRTVEDSSVPASLLSSPEEVGGDVQRKTTATLGFTHFLDMDRTQDGSAEEDEEDRRGKEDAVGAGRSLGFQFGQAPVRWAWCAASQEGGSSLDGSSQQSQQQRGEWLAFNYAAAATAPLDTAATGDGLMGMGMNGIGMGMNMGMGMGLGMGMGMNMGMNMMPLPMSMQIPLPLPMSMQMPMAPPMQMPVSMPLPMPMGMPSMPMSMSMPMPMSNPFGGHPDPSSGAGLNSSGGMMGISMPMSMPASSIAPS